MLLKAAQFVSVVLVALVTGVFWGSWLGLSRFSAELPLHDDARVVMQ